MRLVLRLFTFSLLSVLLFTSCQREIEGELPNNGNGNPPTGEMVIAGIRGTVVDENNLPVQGATVTCGTHHTTTDRYGVFRFSQVSLLKANGFVKVSRPGYFSGLRSFPVTAGRVHNLRIKLIPKTNTGNFNAATGGTISLAGGAKMVMPASAIVDQAGSAYNGTVNVAMTWIDPTTDDFPDRLPGDLRGISNTGGEMGLESFGMIGVELTTMGGQPLKIATGKMAELSFPIPAAIAGQAPATIDLWHFDENEGRWKQEGQAAKSGNNYIAQVSHFSFWNCDAPFPLVDLCLTLVQPPHGPLNNIQVRIYRPDNSYGAGYTDSLGNLCGKVPKDEPLILKVLDRCHNVVFTQNIGPFSSNTNLGTLPVTVTSNTITFTGTVTNCSGGNVANGAAIIYTPTGHSYSVPVTAGVFSFNLFVCDANPITVSIIGVDYSTQQQSVAVTATGTPGTVNAGTVQACGTSSAEFMDFLIDGVPFVYSTPADNFHTVDSSGGPGPYTFHYTPRASKTTNMMATFSFYNNGVAASGLPITFCYLMSSVGNSNTILSPSPTLNITNIGAPQTGFIEGNFNISMDFSGTARTVSCNFRVRRP